VAFFLISSNREVNVKPIDKLKLRPMTAYSEKGLTFDTKPTKHPVRTSNRRKPVRIKDVHQKRIEAMQSLNEELARNHTFFEFFKTASLATYKDEARGLSFAIWYDADKKALAEYLSRHVRSQYYSIKKDKRDKIITLLQDFITDRNRLFFATEVNYQEINTTLIRGNLTQDFLFALIEEELPRQLAGEFKECIRTIIRAITIIQYSCIQKARSKWNFINRLISRKNRQLNIDKLLSHFDEKTFRKSVLKLVEKKLDNGSVRSSFARWTFEHIKERSTNRSSHDVDGFLRDDFPLLIEIAMSIMYYDNQVLDNKGDVSKLEEIKENLIARTFLKDWCFEYVEHKLIKPEQQQLVGRHLRKIFSSVDVGQHLDKTWNTLEVFENNNFYYDGLSERLFKSLWPDEQHVAWPFMRDWIKKMRLWVDYTFLLEAFENIRRENWSKSHYLNLYLDRIFLTNSALFLSIVELNCELTGYFGDQRNRLSALAVGYGMSLQIVNDYADFIPVPWHYKRENETVEKKASDVYKDLLNRTISLPLIVHFGRKNKNRLIYRLAKSRPEKITRIQRFNLQKELYQSEALKTCVQITQQMVRIYNKDEAFRLDRLCAASMFLRDLPSICFFNRYNKERHIIEANFRILEKVSDYCWNLVHTLGEQWKASKIFVKQSWKSLAHITIFYIKNPKNILVQNGLLQRTIKEGIVILILEKLKQAFSVLDSVSSGYSWCTRVISTMYLGVLGFFYRRPI
jgi:hypothetical protein